jgi:carboxymethylenebutenolidase
MRVHWENSIVRISGCIPSFLTGQEVLIMTEQQNIPSFLHRPSLSEITAEDCRLSPSLGGAIARPKGPGPHPAVIVFMEAFGVNRYIRDVLRLMASEGFIAVAPDLFEGKTYEYTDFQGAIGHLSRLKDSIVMDQTRQTLDWLEKQGDVQKNRIGAMGFCMGGRLTFLSLSTFPDRLKAGVSFYGGSIGHEGLDQLGRPEVLSGAGRITAPVLLLYGAKDESIPPEEHGRIAQTLSGLNKTYLMGVYPDALHGFFCWQRGSYLEQAARPAWKLVSSFLGDHLKASGK